MMVIPHADKTVNFTLFIVSLGITLLAMGPIALRLWP